MAITRPTTDHPSSATKANPERQDVAGVAQVQRRCRAFAMQHLGTCCAELHQWHRTGVLPMGKLRELAALCTHVPSYDRTQHAERLVEMAAIEYLAEHGQTPLQEEANGH